MSGNRSPNLCRRGVDCWSSGLVSRSPPEPPEWTEGGQRWPGYVVGTMAVPLVGWGLYTLWVRYGRREEEAAALILSHAEEAISALDAGEKRGRHHPALLCNHALDFRKGAESTPYARNDPSRIRISAAGVGLT